MLADGYEPPSASLNPEVASVVGSFTSGMEVDKSWYPPKFFWVRRRSIEEKAKHNCVRDNLPNITELRSLDHNSLARCKCGKLWRAHTRLFTEWGWKRAHWWTRLRYAFFYGVNE